MKKIALAVFSTTLLTGATNPDNLRKKELDIVDFSKGEVIEIIGDIGPLMMPLASEIDELSKTAKEINIFINSPGGVILVADQIIAAIEIAKTRDVTVNCAVTVYAASAAFQILSHCSERYVFENAMLLFHPSRVNQLREPLRADGAESLAERLREIDDRLVRDLQKEMQMDPALFKKAYELEKWWNARQLQAATKDFLTIVKRVDGIDTFKVEAAQRRITVTPSK